MVAHAHDAYVGPPGQFLGRSVGIPALEAHLRLRAVHGGLDAVERAHAVGREGAVPVLEHLFGPVAEDGNLLHLLPVQGQEIPFVLEEDDGLLRDEPGLVLEFLAFPGQVLLRTERLGVIRAFRVQQAQPQHGSEIGFRARVQHLVADESAVVRSLHLFEAGVDKPGQAGLQGHPDGLVHAFGVVVHLRQVHEHECAGIVHDGAFHAPLVVQDVLDKGSGDARNTVIGVVRGHQGHGPGAGALPEAIGIVVPEEFFVKAGVGAVAVVLVAVREEVLHQRGAPPVARVVALDALHLGGDHFAHQVRVLAEALLGAAPAGVAGKVGVRRPEDQALPGIVLGIETGFVGHHVADGAGHLAVPGLPDAVSLREGGAVAVFGRGTSGPIAELAGIAEVRQFGVSAAHDAVDRFGGTGIGDPEARNALADQGGDLLVDRHQGNRIVQALLFGKLRILEGILLGAQQSTSCHEQA